MSTYAHVKRKTWLGQLLFPFSCPIPRFSKVKTIHSSKTNRKEKNVLAIAIGIVDGPQFRPVGSFDTEMAHRFTDPFNLWPDAQLLEERDHGGVQRDRTAHGTHHDGSFKDQVVDFLVFWQPFQHDSDG